MKTVELCIPSQPEYVTTLRLVTASVGQHMGFDFDVIEDLRICVSEAVNYLLASNERIAVHFEEEEDRLVVAIDAKTDETDMEGAELHHQIMESLMDTVEVSEERILLTKYRG